MNDSKYCRRVIERKQPFEKSTKCCICKKPYKEGDAKVKDRGQITGKYRGSVHQDYNLNFTLTKSTSVVFHNLQICDSHLLFQEVEKCNYNIENSDAKNMIPKTIEQKNVKQLWHLTQEFEV